MPAKYGDFFHSYALKAPSLSHPMKRLARLIFPLFCLIIRLTSSHHRLGSTSSLVTATDRFILPTHIWHHRSNIEPPRSFLFFLRLNPAIYSSLHTYIPSDTSPRPSASNASFKLDHGCPFSSSSIHSSSETGGWPLWFDPSSPFSEPAKGRAPIEALGWPSLPGLWARALMGGVISLTWYPTQNAALLST